MTPQHPAAPETETDNWWDAVTHESLRRLAGTDPALLGPVGRELHEYAQARRAHPPADDVSEWREQVGQRLMLTITCAHGEDYFGTGAVCETCFTNVQRIGRIIERDRGALLADLDAARERVRVVEGDRDRLRKGIEALEKSGLRGFDMNPTRPIAGWDDADWMAYLRKHDDFWRNALTTLLGGGEAR